MTESSYGLSPLLADLSSQRYATIAMCERSRFVLGSNGSNGSTGA